MSRLSRAHIAALVLVFWLSAATDGICQSVARKLLFVVPSTSLSRDDRQRQRLFKSWGFKVVRIAHDASIEEMNLTAQKCAVCYISETCLPSSVGRKLSDNPIGIVTDDYWLNDELGFSRSLSYRAGSPPATITNNSHPITQGLSLGATLPDLLGNGQIAVAASTLAPGAVVLSKQNGAPHFMALEKIAALHNGGFAAGRRALIAHISFPKLDSATTDLLRRAVLWAAATPPDRTYFVRRSGRDTNSGLSPGQAFRSIRHAARFASAGDTVYVGGGDYKNNVVIVNGGRRGRPLRLIADTSGAKTGDKGAAKLKGVGRGRTLSLSNKSDVTIRRLTVSEGYFTVQVLSSHRVLLDRCKINRSRYYAGVYFRDGSLRLKDTEVESHRYYGVMVYGKGDFQMVGGSAKKNGYGGAYVYSTDNTASSRFRQVEFKNKHYGVVAQRGDCLAEECRFTKNRYGFLSIHYPNSTVRDCTFDENHVGVYAHNYRGGRLHLDRSKVFNSRSHGVLAYYAGTALTNCLVADNRSYGVYAYGAGRGNNLKTPTTVYNCTVVNSKRDGLRVYSGKVRNCLTAYNGRHGIYASSTSQLNNLSYGNRKRNFNVTHDTNIEKDPEFVNRGKDDFHVLASSPAIDGGTSTVALTFDLDKINRPQGITHDIGCYEREGAIRLRIVQWKEVR
ncbi:MAG: right-handed parallel beta-helix repeat-containing protein [Pirellulaceae bacterium]|nr:right-handed parallel beta-helix repeat-containing protein [Pirellulaceae bacterium]